MLREHRSIYTALAWILLTVSLVHILESHVRADAPETVQIGAESAPDDGGQQSSQTDLYGDGLPDRASMRYGTIRLRYNQRGYNASFSIDSRQIYSSDGSSLVQIWNLDSSCAARLDLGDHAGSAVFLPDCRHLLVNRFTGVTLRDMPSGQVVAEIPSEQDNYRDMKLSPNGFWLASMPAQDVLQMWDTQSGDELLTLHPLDARRDGYEAFTFSPNSRLVAIALRTGVIQIWDLHQGGVIQELTPQKQPVRWQSFHFLDDNRLLGCGSTSRRNENGRYEMVSHLEQWRLDEPDASEMLDMDKRELLGEPNACLSLDRSVLATTHQNEIVLWDMRNGKAVNSLVAKKEVGYQLAIAPNNHLIASTGRNSKLLIWDLKSGEELHPQPNAHHGSVLAISESPNGKVLVSVGAAGTTRAWGRETGEHLRVLHRNVGENFNDGWTRDVEFFPDGDRVLLCTECFDPQSPGPSFKGRVAIVRLGDGELLREWSLLDRGMQVAVNENGNIIAFATGLGSQPFGNGDAPSPEVQVWDVTQDRMVAKLSNAPGNLTGLVFHGDQQLYLQLNTGAYVWNTSDTAAQILFPKQDANPAQRPVCAILAKDVESILTSSSEYSRQDKISTGRLARIKLDDGSVLWEKNSVGQVAYGMTESPDGQVLAVPLFPSNKLIFLNSNTGKVVDSLQLDNAVIGSMQFSRDGTRLYAGMNRGDIIRWDMQKILQAGRGRK